MRLRGEMPCEVSCLEDPGRVVYGDCCHSCAFYVDEECRVPAGGGFSPRFLWRMVREG